jgi:hypothetical protein
MPGGPVGPIGERAGRQQHQKYQDRQQTKDAATTRQMARARNGGLILDVHVRLVAASPAFVGSRAKPLKQIGLGPSDDDQLLSVC